MCTKCKLARNYKYIREYKLFIAAYIYGNKVILLLDS